eukprot:66999_1
MAARSIGNKVSTRKNITIVYTVLGLTIIYLGIGIMTGKNLIYISNKNLEQNQQNETNINSSRNQEIAFIHVPKTGGKMVELLLYNEYGIQAYGTVKDPMLTKSHWPCSQHHIPLSWIYGYTKNNLSQISPYYANFKNLTASSFTIVRNPYTRFISQYQWMKKVWIFRFARKNCHTFSKNISKCDKLHSRRQYDICNVENFNFVSNILLKRIKIIGKRRHFSLFDCHYVRQYEYVYDSNNNNKQMVGTILRTETLSNELITFLHSHNLSIDMELVNKYREKAKWHKYCENLKVDDLNIENRQLIYQVYNKDFLYFNYSQ